MFTPHQTGDGGALETVAASLTEGHPQLARVAAGALLEWWSEPSHGLGVALGQEYAEWYPDHYAILTVEPKDLPLAVEGHGVLAQAIGGAIGHRNPYYPVSLEVVAAAAQPEPPPAPVPTEVRDGHELTPIEVKFYDELRETDLAFSPQVTIRGTDATYRPDFIVYPRGGRPVVVELDGHDFHSSKEQRTADAQRERWLTARGFDFIRFTGSEVWADPQACVRELRDWARMRNAS